MAWLFDPMTGEIRFERLQSVAPVGDVCTRFVYRLATTSDAILTLHADACMVIVNGPSAQQSILSGSLDLGL
jgi:hypothetical protein